MKLCDECGHAVSAHGRYGCEVERGDAWVTGNQSSSPTVLMAQGPCGCDAYGLTQERRRETNDEPQMKLKHFVGAFLFGLLMWWADQACVLGGGHMKSTKDTNVPVITDKATRQRVRRLLGRRGKQVCRVVIEFDMFAPASHGDMGTDEVLLLDTLDNLSEHVIGFHDVPGFRLHSYRANGRTVI